MLPRKDPRTAARSSVIVASARSWMLAAIALGSSGPASAAMNQFTLIGPDGGFVSNVLIHPTTPSIVFALTAGGCYRSTDGGLTWRIVRADVPFPPEDVAVDPLDPTHIIITVVGQSPLVSTDLGATFVGMSGWPVPKFGARHIEFAAGSPVAYATLGVRVFRSTDGGRGWTEKTPVTANSNSELQFLRVDPANPDVVYVYNLNDGGFRSTNGGNSWQPIPLPNPTWDVAITSATLWAVSPFSGVHRSTDGGATWPQVLGNSASAIAVDPTDPSVVYAGIPDGLFRTDSAGNGWANVQTDGVRVGQITSISVNPLEPAKLMFAGAAGIAAGEPNTMGIGGVWEPRNQGIRAASAGDMSVAAGAGRLYINTFGAGVHFLANGAAATTPVNNAALLASLLPGSSMNTFGLLARTRGANDRLFVGASDGYMRSEDGGETWQQANTGDANTVEHFADSPGNPDLILASTSVGLRRSIDGGGGWAPVTSGLPAQARAHALVFSSSSPDTAYAALQSPAGQHGVYKSIDGGVSWSAANTGFATTEIRAIAVDPRDSQVVYAAANPDGLLKSTNGGASWTTLAWATQPESTLAVAIDPDVPDIVYVAGFAALARSIDGGQAWQELRSAAVPPEWRPNALLADPRRPGALLVSTFNQGVADMTIAPNLVLESGGSFVNPLVPGGEETFRYRLRNAGPFHATGARAVVTLPADATGISATTTNGACAVQGTTVTCTAPALLTAATADIVVRSTHPTAGTIEVLASASADQPDSEPASNELRYTVTVAQPVTPPPPSSGGGGGGGGGGGSDSLLGMLALGALRMMRLRRKKSG